MPDKDDIWYAANATRVVFAPERLLETFGETSVRYFLLSELLDEVGRVRVRKGRVTAERPRVITPQYFVNQALENFGPEAREYAEQVLHSAEGVRIIEYGLRFRKQELSEELVEGDVREVAEQIAEDVRDKPTDLYGVVIGVDDLWEVSLFSFISDVVKRSLPRNAAEMARRGLLDTGSGQVPNAVRIEIEGDFRAAAGDRTKLRRLAEKLRRYGLFEQYQDRFFACYNSAG